MEPKYSTVNKPYCDSPGLVLGVIRHIVLPSGREHSGSHNWAVGTGAPAMQETWVPSLGWEDALEEG